MKNLTYETFLANPAAVMEAVRRQARRERAEAVRQLIVLPLMRLFARIPTLKPQSA